MDKKYNGIKEAIERILIYPLENIESSPDWNLINQFAKDTLVENFRKGLIPGEWCKMIKFNIVSEKEITIEYLYGTGTEELNGLLRISE